MIDRAITYMQTVFSEDFSGHDADHTLRVYRLALRIAEAEGANQETVALAALLHDVDDRKLSPETTKGKLRAKAFLEGEGMAEGEIQHFVEKNKIK